MAALPSSPAWTRAVYPPALPYGMLHRCFPHCEPTPEFQIDRLPAPCICIGEAALPTPRITSSVSANGAVGQAFSYQITAFVPTGGSPVTEFGATGLPSWASVDAATGLITGTPTTSGPISFTVLAKNAEGAGSQMVRGNISGAAVGPGHGPMHYGVIATNTAPTTEAEIDALAGTNANANAGSKASVTLATGAWGIAFAYPDTLPSPPHSIIATPPGSDVTGSLTYAHVTRAGGEGLHVYYQLNAIAAPVPGATFALTI